MLFKKNSSGSEHRLLARIVTSNSGVALYSRLSVL